MKLGEIMTIHVATVSQEDTAEFAWHLMEQRNIHHLVVIDGPKVVGLVSHRDLAGNMGNRVLADLKVCDVMTRTLITARPHTSLSEAADLMTGYTIGCLPILGDDKKLVGIVTITDLLMLLSRLSKAAVGP
jgi:acetoin utilization protein AcuB